MALRMNMPEAINKAIGSHGLWKSNLTEAIQTGKSELTVAKASSDSQCEFGKWLATLSPAEASHPEVVKVKGLHTAFHAAAGSTLGLALSGKKPEALKSMEIGGAFAKASAELTMHMMAWKKSLPA